MRVAATLTGLDAALDALARELGAEVPHGMEAAASVVAADAVAEHPYTDRTGTLTGSIHAEPVGFTSLADAEARVVAAAPYASYVDDREAFAFLEPSFRASEYQAVAALDASLQRAADDAGWKP